MIMSPLWRNRWPLLRWSLFALVLVGLGWVLHAWLPPKPRWVLRASLDPLGLSPDGKTIRTQTGSGNPNLLLDGSRRFKVMHLLGAEMHGGPIQFWDVVSGREVQRFVDDVSVVDDVAFSGDGRRLYAVARQTGDRPSTHLHHAELDTGRETQVLIEEDALRWVLHPSPGGKLLLVESSRYALLTAAPNELAGRPQFVLVYDALSLRLIFKEDAKGWHWQWTRDGNTLLLYDAHDNNKATLRRITAQGETITRFNGVGSWRGVTPDGKTLLTDWPVIAEGDDLGPSVLLWDTATGKRLGEVPGFGRLKSPGISAEFIGNRRTLVIAQDVPPMVVAWDLDTHAPLGKVPLEDRRIVVSSEYNAFALHRADGDGVLTLYRPRPFALLWQRHLAGELRGVEFLPGANRLVAATGTGADQRLVVLDVETGQTCFEVPVLNGHRIVPCGRYLAIEETVSIAAESRGLFKTVVDKCFALVLRDLAARAGHDTIARVFDTQSGEQLGRLERRGANLVEVSPDGRSIFMLEEEREGSGGSLSCYDVPPRAYWVWIIGIPLAVAVLLLALRAGWRRWQRRPRSVGDVASVAASGGYPASPTPEGASS